MRLPFPCIPALILATALCGLTHAETFRPATFDQAAARRTSDLDASDQPAPLPASAATGVSLREVRFASTAWSEEGIAHRITIHGYLAIPSNGGRLPAVISAHGLGGKADPSDALELARNLHVVAFALSAPGAGKSEGEGPTAEDPRPIFRAGRDIRASWVYQYVFAIMRAITYLQTRNDVDPKGIVVTGFSMGGIATFLVGGVDDRLAGTLPVGASGGLARAAGTDTWFRRLVLASGGITPSDPGPKSLFRKLDPLAFAGRQKCPVYVLSGAQDEFFPIDQLIRTYKAIANPQHVKSLEIVADFDHSWYFGGGCTAACMPKETTSTRQTAANAIAQERGVLPSVTQKSPMPQHRRDGQAPCRADCPKTCPTGQVPPYCGPEGSYNRHADFWARRALLLRALISQHATHPKGELGPPPVAPVVVRTHNEVVVRVVMQPPPVAVRLAVSENGGYTYGQFELERDAADGAWHYRHTVSPKAILIGEAETADGATATSVPNLPKGFHPKIRPFGPPPR